MEKSRDRRRKKGRDNTRDSEEEEDACTYEEVMDREMGSRDSGFFTPGTRKKETIEEKKTPTTQRKLVTENLSERKSLTHDYQNGEEKASRYSGFGARKKATENLSEENCLTHNHQDGDVSVSPGNSGVWGISGDRAVNGLRDLPARPGTSGVGGTLGDRAVNGMRDPLAWPSASSVSGTQGDRIVNGMRDPSTRPSPSDVRTSTPRGTINDMIQMCLEDSESEKGLSGLGAGRKEKVEKKKKKKRPLTHRHDQNRDVSARPGTSGVGGTLGDRAVNGYGLSRKRGKIVKKRWTEDESSMETFSGHIKTIIKSECLTVMKDVLTTALEKVAALESKATKRTIEYEQISPTETPKKKRELSPASSVEVPILVTTVQRSSSAVGQYPEVPRPGTSGNHHPVDGMTSVTSSQWRQQWMTIDNDHHSVVSGVSTQWRQHRTTDDDGDSDNSGTISPQSERKSFFERQDLSHTDEEQPEDTVVEDLSCNLLECSIDGRSPGKTRKGSKSNEMYEMSSVKINLLSTSSYVGSPTDRSPFGHVVSSPSRSQPPPNANQRPIIRQPRLSLPPTPPQTVNDAGARNCRCPRCGSVWGSELELEEHYFEHLLGNRSCTVGGCEYTCSSRNELRRHIRAAHLRRHTCRRCGKAYLMASTLERHLRQCLPCRQCPLCPRACVGDASPCDHVHVASAHGGQIACNRPELKYYVCRECRFATTSRTVALDHCQRHILGEINLNITLCEICDLLFVTGDLHFLMHAVDDSLNRKSFQVVDFDWRVSLNARRQLESSLKKIKATKAIKASIDEETSTARANVEEINIETSDIVVPQTEAQNKSQDNDDSTQENYNNRDLNQKKIDVTDKLIDTNLSPIGKSNNNMQHFKQKCVAQIGTASKNQSPNTTKQEDVLKAGTKKELIQSESLEQQPTVVEKKQSNDNVDNNNQRLPSSSTEEVQNQNAALYPEPPSSITTTEELNEQTTAIMASPNEVNLKSPVILNGKEARDNSVEETLQENNKHTSLDHANESNKPNSSKLGGNLDKVTDSTDKKIAQFGTDSKTQLLNTTQKEDVLEPSTKKEPVQRETLVDRCLEQQPTVAMSQSNNNVDNSQSLPSSLAAEAQNEALDEETSTATNFEEFNVKTNDVITSSSEMHHNEEASIDSVEENKSLQQTNVNHTEENIDRIKNSVQEIKDLMQEAKKTKGPVQSEILVELNKFHVTDQLIKTHLSRLRRSINNMQDLTQKFLARRGTVSQNQSPNTTQHEEVLESSMMNEPVESETLGERPLEPHNTVAMSQSNDNVHNSQSLPSSSTAEVQNLNATLNEETPISKTDFKESNVETNDIIAPPIDIHLKSQVIINDNEARVESVNKNTSPQENNKQTFLDHTKELNKCGPISKNQSPHATQKEDVLEASTMKEPVQSVTLVERPLDQHNTVAMSQSNDNVHNSQSLPSSSTAEVQNQNATLNYETPIAKTNLKESNVETNDIIAPRIDIHLESQVIINDNEARVDSVKENTSDQENKKQISLNQTKELDKSNSSKLRENLDKPTGVMDNKLAQCGTDSKRHLSNTTLQEDVLEANTIKEPVQSETLVEMSQPNSNVDNNQSLPSSSTAEVQNQYVALDREAITSRSNIEDLNGIIAPSNEMQIKSQVIDINEEASGYSEEQNTWLNLTKSRVSQSIELMQEINNILQQFESPVAQQTILKSSELKDNTDNIQSSETPFSSTAEVLNQNAALDEETPTAVSNFEDSNIETTDIMASPDEVNLESQVILNDKEARDDSVEENISLQVNNKNTSLDYTNELKKPNSSQLRENKNFAHYGTDSKNLLSNTTQHEDLLEANTMKDSELSETSVERPPEQQTTVDMSQFNDNVDNNKSISSSLAVEVQNENAALNEESSSLNFEEPHIENNQNTVSNGDAKTTTKEDVVNDQNLIRLYASKSATVNQTYKNNNETSTNAGEPKFSASKIDGSAIVNENKQKYKVNTNQTKKKQILIKYSQRKQENNDEASIDNNDSVKVALSSTGINITISRSKNLSVTAVDKATQASVENALSSGSPKKETITNGVVSDKAEDQITTKETNPGEADQTGAEGAEEPKSSVASETVENAVTEKVLAEKLHVASTAKKTMRSVSETKKKSAKAEKANSQNTVLSKATQSSVENPMTLVSAVEESNAKEVLKKAQEAKDTKNSSSTNDETIIRGDLDKSPGETSVRESMSSGCPKEETITNDVVSDKAEDPISIEVTKTLEIITKETNSGKADQTSAEGAEEPKSSVSTETVENAVTEKVLTEKPRVESPAKKTMSSVSESKKSSVTAEEANSQNIVLNKATQSSVENPMLSPTEDTDTKKVVSKMSHDESTAKDTKNSSSTNNETIIKGDLDKVPGETSFRESMSSGSSKKTTITTGVVADKAEDPISIEVTKTSAITTKETNSEKADQTSAEGAEEPKSSVSTETVENSVTEKVLTEKPRVESPAKKTMSSVSETKKHSVTAEEANSQNIVHNKATQTSVENPMLSPTEDTDTKKIVSKMTQDESTAKDTKNSSSTNDETIIKGDLAKVPGETSFRESMSSGSPKEATITTGVVSDKAEDLISGVEESNAKEVLKKAQKAQDQTITERTTRLFSPTEETDANGETSSHENKTVAIEKTRNLTSKANPDTSAKIIEESYPEKEGFENTHGQINAEGTENFVATAENNDTKQVLTENSHDETTATETKNSTSSINITKASDHTCAKETTNPGSPAEKSNSKEISDDKTNNEETKTDSEEVLEKGQESQNQTSTDKTNSLEKTTKETGVKNHLQKTRGLNTVENGMQNEKNITNAKDETFSETAVTTSKKGQQTNRGRGRSNKKRNNKNTSKGK